MAITRFFIICTTILLCGINLNSNENSDDWVLIPSGNFIPFFTDTIRPKKVEAFHIKTTQVTNKEFLEFVKAKPKWKKSKIKSIFAEKNYLDHWESDTVLGESVNPNAPVVNVSWFAANAYCDWIGGRLPDMEEWEYVASADSSGVNKYNSVKFKNRILSLYERMPKLPLPDVKQFYKNHFGVYDMHGFVWEWTRNFNSVMISGESRKDNSLDRNLFCAAGSLGSVDPAHYAAFLRYSLWGSLKAKYCLKNVGFRCVKEK